MFRLPFIGKFTLQALAEVLTHYPRTEEISSETRQSFTADFPHHNRYFSNGDRPLVALVKKKGYVKLTYAGEDFLLGDGDFVFFDDNVHHSWIMKDCDLEVFYYRQAKGDFASVAHGDYCLDTFFH